MEMGRKISKEEVVEKLKDDGDFDRLRLNIIPLQGKFVLNNEEDIGTYRIKAIDDPRTLNKILYIRRPMNTYSFNALVSLWEKKIDFDLKPSLLLIQFRLLISTDVFTSFNYSAEASPLNYSLDTQSSQGIRSGGVYTRCWWGGLKKK